MEPSADSPVMDAQEIRDFANRTTDGSQREFKNKASFDYRAYYGYMDDTTRLLLSKDELTWMDTNAAPDRVVDVFVNMSCNSKLAPHLTVETVDVLKALDVNFVAALGRQFCCGKIYRVTDRERAGVRMSAGSLRRFSEWGASTAVHHCPSCQIYYEDHLRRMPQAAPGLVNRHFATFLEQRLEELGDRVPWKSEVKAKVLVEGHPEVSPVHAAAMQTALRILAKVPGVEVLGVLESPSFGSACKTGSDTQSVLAFLSAEERRQLHAELDAQAEAAGGADTIAPSDKFCQAEWCKWATDRLGVRHYLSIVAEALGCGHPDRFQAMWKLNDTSEVFERTRPHWSSWGLTEDQARGLVVRHFDRMHSGFEPTCACGGDPGKCNTGRNPLPVALETPADIGRNG